MIESEKQVYVVIIFLAFGPLFILLGRQGLPYFLFWEFTIGIGGSIAVRQQEKKEMKNEES